MKRVLILFVIFGLLTMIGPARTLDSSIQALQMPALTGDCTSTVGTVATTCTKINGVDQTTAWTAFTPSPTCGTGTVTSASARSKTMGKTTWMQGDLTLTVLGNCGPGVTNITFNLPNTAQSVGNLHGREIVNNVGINCLISASGTTGNCLKDAGTAWVVNDHIQFSGVYENQ